VSVSMASKVGTPGVIFRWLSLITLIEFDLELQNSTGGGAYFYGVIDALAAMGRGPSATYFLGSLLFLHTHINPLTHNYRSWRGNTIYGERACFLDGKPCPYAKGALSQRSAIFGFLSIYAHILCCRTTEFKKKL